MPEIALAITSPSSRSWSGHLVGPAYRRLLDLMCDRANARVIDPNGETLADRQVIQHWVAELDAEGGRRRHPGARRLGGSPTTRCSRIYEGADEVHKTSLGRRILRRYASQS